MVPTAGHGTGACRNIREQVVDNVVLDDAVEEVASDKTEFSVDRGQSTFDKCPAAGVKVRHLDVGVVQIRDGD